MKYEKIYRPDLLWSFIIKSKTTEENYVLSNTDDANVLKEFLENRKENEEIPENIQKIINNSKTEEFIMTKKKEKKILWVVDAQNDFMKPDGLLYVEGAEKIIPNIKKHIERFQKIETDNFHDPLIICTMDLHKENSAELSTNPDFVNTFPKHCMADSDGADLVDEIAEVIYPVSVDVIDWFDYYNYQDLCEIARQQKIIITKDKFDVFSGNPFTDKLLEIIKPDTVYVCGLATSICVNYAVLGLLKRGIRVYILTDSIKDLPSFGSSKATIDKWVSAGAILV